MRHPKVVILGSGPAGLTAAIYTARANLETLVIRSSQYGGLITPAGQLENYPGFLGDTGGIELYERLERQAEQSGVQFMEALIRQVDLSRQPFSLTTDGGEGIRADSLIIAAGASPRHLGLPGEEPRLVIEGVLPYLGYPPHPNLFQGQLHLDRAGYILTDGRTRTNIAGVFATGEVIDPVYRQAIPAAGQGSMAALEAAWFLSEQESLARKSPPAVSFDPVGIYAAEIGLAAR